MNGVVKIRFYKSPYGELILGSFDDRLCLCDWKYRKMRPGIDKRIKAALKAEYKPGNSNTLEQTILQLEEYFNEARETFDLPLELAGTEFQKQVWNALLNIPYGSTDTYLGLSQKIGNEAAIRAIASANGANAISIIVPCHRIIGSDGSMVGYAGGLKVKEKLLLHEKALQGEQLSIF